MKRKFLFKEEPFGRAFVENSDKSVSEQIGYALVESAAYRFIEYPDNCMLPTVKAFSENGASFYEFGSGIGIDRNAFERLIEAFPEDKEDLSEIRDYMTVASTGYHAHGDSTTGYEKKLIDAMAFWGGSWIGHANPDYDRILHTGTDGFRTFIEECRQKNPGKDGFYNATGLAMDAIDIVADRILKTAVQNAQTETDEAKRKEWARMAKAFEIIPRKPAYDMYSAVMMFWLFFTFDGTDSPGRLDQCMIDYYRVSAPEESEEMITRLLEGIHNIRAWNLCISGSDEHWNDETNELSYLFLRKVREMAYQTPNLTMRVHRNTPEALWKLAAECLATGNGLPAIYNDEVVCPALEAIGIPPYDSHDYCMNGCNQIDIMGKSHMGLEDGEVNMGKVLELTLHNGVNFAPEKPVVLAHRFGDARSCKSFEELMTLYYRMLDHITDLTVTVANRFQEAYAFFAPNPLRSVTIQGCLEKGLDYKSGGPLYGHGQVLLQGIADTADSLWAIKTMVFEKQSYTMDELIDALEANFEGYEALRRDFSSCDKFGNDMDGVDEFCAQTVDHIFKYLKTKTTFRGGVYTGGCSPFVSAPSKGHAVAALPNGKLKGESNYADSIAATPGRDMNGPTALLKSMLHYRQTEACSGFVAQIKMAKSVFCTEGGMQAFITLAKVYFAGGGQQLSVNVVDRATLLAAQKEPEKYRNLIVRVGGFSDYFRNLTPELQQNVIDRTEFSLS